MSSEPTVVIVGRPNAGKSTLFNRLCESRRAITSPIAGTTRDWLEGRCFWNGRVYRLVDTGGYAPGADDVMAGVRKQVERWLKDADAVIWVTDAAEGMTPADQNFAKLLRPVADRVILAANKADAAKHDAGAGDFARLGFKTVIPVSASHGRRITPLLEALEERIKAAPAAVETPADETRVAIVGRPNAGKSSLANKILGEERMIVSPVPGTTRDPIDARVEADGKNFLFVDTAGLRAAKSKADDLEGLTRLMTERALERAEVALLLVDATQGLTDGDVAVGRLIDEKHRGCVLAVNKWDLVDDRAPTSKMFRERAEDGMAFLAHAPILFISAKTGHHVPELLKTLAKTGAEFHRRLDDDELMAFLWTQVQERPFSHHGKKLHLHGAQQVAEAPPIFMIRTNMEPKEVHFSYQRHLERVLRERFGFAGVPLVLRFRRGKK